MDHLALPRNVKGPPQFETVRLIGREWSIEDAQAAFTIYGDSEVQAGLAGAPEKSIESQRANLALAIAAYRERPIGTGFWALERKVDRRIVGASVVKPLPGNESCYEVGWQVARAHWGHGYATEGARGAIQLAFQHLPVDRLLCLVKEWNTRSLRVAEKLGFLLIGTTTDYYGIELLQFELTRAHASVSGVAAPSAPM